MKYSDLKKLNKEEIKNIIIDLFKLNLNFDINYWIDDNLKFNLENDRLLFFNNDIFIDLNNYIKLIEFENSIIIIERSEFLFKPLYPNLCDVINIDTVIIINSDNLNLNLEDIKNIIELNKNL